MLVVPTEPRLHHINDINVLMYSCKLPLIFRPILTKLLNFTTEFSEGLQCKISRKFVQRGRQTVKCGRTDAIKLTVSFHVRFVNAPEKKKQFRFDVILNVHRR